MTYSSALPEFRIKSVLCDTARILSGRRLLWQHVGSLSVKIDASAFWLTPTGEHPALLTPDRLLRAHISGRVWGKAAVSQEDILHHRRIYLQAQDAKAVFMLRPPYIQALLNSDNYANLPPEQMNEELSLCDKAKSAQILLCGQLVVCWSDSLTSLIERVEEMDFAMCSVPTTAPAGHTKPETADKQALIRMVVDSVTQKLKETGRG